jgi:hypothetical protein
LCFRAPCIVPQGTLTSVVGHLAEVKHVRFGGRDQGAKRTSGRGVKNDANDPKADIRDHILLRCTPRFMNREALLVAGRPLPLA